jgi:YHS domain-containing protein
MVNSAADVRIYANIKSNIEGATFYFDSLRGANFINNGIQYVNNQNTVKSVV